ncbi:FecR domain-containing protein [Flavitalea sp. BT771]|uniref:FecR family protein n=1 Tax=Flavitalea sp. BT771 TaxID=3063329 RepID=UPI0026E133B5|nr:FecR domain-containing protein [Flavitalea sp. BT771]MDO6433314.1 FecR domain-containing protein [Flavitalea sp. BT771]MDV6222781.1 FecR domain-containing protein [Flavitalea sp. BT771]
MKKASFYFLIAGLLAVTADEVLYFRRLRQHYRDRVKASPTMVFVSALRGQQKTVTLPDGSTVWLNAASTLAYPVDMTDGDRTVELFGEAFFDVVAQPSHPFQVRAKEMFIEVLGTRFNVRNYPEEISSHAMVVSGNIRVSYHDQAATLHSGEAANVDPADLSGRALSLRRGVDTASAADWTKGLLTFTNVDLPGLLHDLSRAYNVDIQLIGPVSDHRFQGKLSLQEPLEEVIARLVVPYMHVTISRPGKQQLIITVNR